MSERVLGYRTARLVPKDGWPDPRLSPWWEPLCKAFGRPYPDEPSEGSKSMEIGSPESSEGPATAPETAKEGHR